VYAVATCRGVLPSLFWAARLIPGWKEKEEEKEGAGIEEKSL